MVNTTYFQLINEALGIDFKCYALAYENKDLGVNGFFEFGIDSDEYEAYFLAKEDKTLSGNSEIIEDILNALGDKIHEEFNIDVIYPDEEKPYSWIGTVFPEMKISFIYEDYVLDEFENEEE